MTPERITHNTLIDAMPSDIWAALVDPDQLREWYAPGCRWEIPELKRGGSVRFFNTETDIQQAIIAHLDPPRELTLSWEADPQRPDLRLMNSFVLEPHGASTRVTISQEGYENLPAADRELWREQDQQALASIVQGLKTHVERVRSMHGF